MLNKALLEPEVSRFINENLKKDLPSLILKGSPFEHITIQELANQIKGVKVAQRKFPEFYANKNLLYPPKLNLEQTSSEITAKYKASLLSGVAGIDLTGGLGIDTYYLAQNFSQFTYCELNTELAEIAAHNFKELKAGNISVNTGNSLEILKESGKRFDWIFADPARRDDHGGKVFKFEDCEPDIPANLGNIFSHTDNLMLKSSPILDISAGINELQMVREVHVIAVRNEVKELLWILNKKHSGGASIKTINFEKDLVQEFSESKDSYHPEVDFSLPQNYLYEPNAAIMKSGMFDELAHRTQAKKLHKHSHLYTSEELLEFPGREFKITNIQDYKTGYLKRYFKNKKANISTRNFPDTVDEIRKRFKIKDGGNQYIFFTTNLKDEKIVIFCEKLL